jgi:hypothetical protein
VHHSSLRCENDICAKLCMTKELIQHRNISKCKEYEEKVKLIYSIKPLRVQRKENNSEVRSHKTVNKTNFGFRLLVKG